jgi:hypothetical protein
MHTSFGRSLRLRASTTHGRVRRAVVAASLPTWLALGAGHALAVPVAGGNDTNVDIGVAACTTLNTQLIPVPFGTVRYCSATGSADVRNPGGLGSTYAFNLTLDNVVCGPLDGGKERTVQFANTPVAGQLVPDTRIKEITSTGFFVVPAGNHYLRWTARPLPGSPATTVLDRSLSVVCTDSRLPSVLLPLAGN